MARRRLFCDEEVENEVDVEDGSGAAGVDLDEKEYEEDGQDEYEKDGFIVDNVDEEEQDEEKETDSDEEKHKKKKTKNKKRKMKKSKAFVLDDDDYQLLEDNNITGFHYSKSYWPLESSGRNFKRLKKAEGDSEQDRQSDFSNNNNPHKSSQKQLLFGENEGTVFEEFTENEEDLEEEEDIVEEDDPTDLIVDEEDYKTGVPLRTVSRSCEKKSSNRTGVSQPELQEAFVVFGDCNGLLTKRKQDLVMDGCYAASHAWSIKRLEHEMEPFVMIEKYMTEKDDHIREIDVPERIQLLEENFDHVLIDARSIEEESAWIYNQLSVSEASPFLGNLHLLGEINKEEIGNVLGMVHVKKLDIPFISMYRKEWCLSLLNDPEPLPGNDDRVERTCRLKWHKKLWAIQNFDRKWQSLQKQKTALESHYSECFEKEIQRIDDEMKLREKKKHFKLVIESLKLSESENEVEDVNLKFNLHFPPGEVVKEGQFKRRIRKSQYANCYEAGLCEVSSKFGFSPEQFGPLLNLEKMYMDELDDLKETPDEVAAKFTSAMFQTTSDVLKGARHMAAIEISSEPCIRKHFRTIFMKNATVSTNPTSDMVACVDSFHELFGMEWLNEKPLSEFKDAQWLLIQKAEEEKLLQVRIELPERVQSKLMCDANISYVSFVASRSAMLWNGQREMTLKEAFFDILLHSMEREARLLLTTRSKNWLLMEYGKKLWEKVSVSPYWQRGNDAGPNDQIAARVLACCWVIGKPGTTFVMLDSQGEILDMMHAGSICVQPQCVFEQQWKKNDEQHLVKFMLLHQPHVVVVGAGNVSAVHLKDRIFEIIYNSFKTQSRADGQNLSEISIVFGDESLPRLYENSQVSSDQLSGQQGIVKRAVALGRYLQNPLCMIATLCGPGREILSWKLHKLDHLLSPDEKYGMIEQVMIDATNQIGFDINLAVTHQWLFAPLQFLSGLGPRKASALQRALVRAGAVFDRRDIAKTGLRKKVFVNVAGFLRVRQNSLATGSGYIIDLLDDTRIHPESYYLAKTMAKNVYDVDVRDQPFDMDGDEMELVIEHVRNRPKLLKILDIDEYSKIVEAELGTRKRETLGDIQMELLSGFQDWCNPYREPDPEEVFYMICSETKDTLAVGRIVQATICRVLSECLICELRSGLRGVIFKEDFLNPDVNWADKVLEGTMLTCKIKEIQRNRYQVLLTCKESGLHKCQLQGSVDLDPYNDEEKGRLRIECVKQSKEKANPQNVPCSSKLTKRIFNPSMIAHPYFQNLSADESTKYLSSKDPDFNARSVSIGTGGNDICNVVGRGAADHCPKHRKSSDWGSNRSGNKNSSWEGRGVGKCGDEKVFGVSKDSGNEDLGEKGSGNASWGASENSGRNCSDLGGVKSVGSSRNNVGRNPTDKGDRHTVDRVGETYRSYSGHGKENSGWDDGDQGGGNNDGWDGIGHGGRGAGRGHGGCGDGGWGGSGSRGGQRCRGWGSSSSSGDGNGSRDGQGAGSGRGCNWNGGNGGWSRGGGSNSGCGEKIVGSGNNAGGSSGWGGANRGGWEGNRGVGNGSGGKRSHASTDGRGTGRNSQKQ